MIAAMDTTYLTDMVQTILVEIHLATIRKACQTKIDFDLIR